MLRIYITLFVATISIVYGLSQIPETSSYSGKMKLNNFKEIMACNDAGTLSGIRFVGNNESQNTSFLCFGDSIQVTHNGDVDLSGDPNPATAPGIIYGVYSCSPMVDGMSLDDLLDDNCLFINPNVPSGDVFYTVAGDISGNVILSNIDFAGQTVPEFYNNGAPVELFYAPITFDNFDENEHEADPATGEAGPCVSISTDEAFSVVYLNPIGLEYTEEIVDCNCTGNVTFSIRGGLPEYDALDQFEMTIRNASGANVFSSTVIEHGVPFTVNLAQGETFEIEIQDGMNCVYSETISTCPNHAALSVGSVNGEPGDIVCVPLTASCLDNIQGLQFSLHYDDQIVELIEIQDRRLDIETGDFSNDVSGELTFSWIGPPTVPIDLMDGDTLFNICFEIIGNNGDQSDIIISGEPTDIEIISSDNGNLIVIRDPNVTTTNGTINVTTSQLVVFDVLQQDVISCHDDETGAIYISVRGGTEPYTIVWTDSNGMEFQTEDLTNVPAGDYTLEISDATVPPYTYSDVFTINAPNPIMVDLEGEDPTCHDDTDGCLVVNNINGGTAPYSYRWFDAANNQIGGANNNRICGFGVGDYEIRVTDSNGCRDTFSQSLFGTPLFANIDSDASTLRTTCSPGSDGELVLLVRGGNISNTGSYQIEWSTGEMNAFQISNLSPGNYAVTVSDDNGCMDTLTDITIGNPQSPYVSFSDVGEISCPGGNDGSAEIIVVSPVSPIRSIEWSNGDEGTNISGLSAGTYYVTLTAEDGCIGLDSIQLEDPDGLDLGMTEIDNASCANVADGSIRINILSGLNDLEIEWSNGENGEFLDSLDAGRYTVYIRDTVRNCIYDSITYIMGAPADISVSFDNILNANCFNQPSSACDGTVTATISGGIAPSNSYTITWSNAQVEVGSLSVNNRLCAGINYITVVDENNCQQIDSISVGSPDELLINNNATTVTSPSCNGDDDGEINLVIQGGIGPYSVVWENTEQSFTRQNLEAGNYSVTITDRNGCRRTSNIVVSEPDSFYIFADLDVSKLNLDCPEDDDGSIRLRTIPVIGSYSYEWSPSVGNGNMANELSPGTYSVTAINSRACRDSLEISITSPPDIEFDLPPITPLNCVGDQTSLVVLNPSGGNGAPYDYSILEDGVDLDIGESYSLFSGEYTISVKDRNGCPRDTVVNIAQARQISVNIPHDTIIRGQEMILAELGEDRTYYFQYTPPSRRLDSVAWNFERSNIDFNTVGMDESAIQARLNKSQTLEVFVVDSNGCTASDNIYIRVDRDRNVFIPNSFSPNGDNQNDIFGVYSGNGVRHINYVKIFNRWGSQVFDLGVTDPLMFNSNATGWDGTFNGKDLQSGVFVYLVEVEFEDGKILLYRGDVTLIK